MPYYTPLRYPGGKRRLVDSVKSLLEFNELNNVVYAETHAGGAAIGLALLLEEYASEIHLNDLSRPIYAFWHTVLNQNRWLCKRIENARMSMHTWRRQRAILRRAESAEIPELGFAALFLNRTNRSGILSGGVIGGKEQNGEWRLDVRFSKDLLVDRIQRIGRYAGRISLYQLDALDFTKQVVAKQGLNTFAFLDPPYIETGGRGLYLSTYRDEDHRRLATVVDHLRCPWVVTYDIGAIRAGLYPDCKRLVYDLEYVAGSRYRGREVMFISDRLELPYTTELLGSRMHLVRHQSRLNVV